MRKQEKTVCILTAAAALAVLFWLFPLTGDDWYREGLGRGLHSLGDLARELIFRWKTTNPRLLGNLLAYISGSRPILRWLLRTALTLLLFRFAAKAAGIRSAAGFALLAVGIFALPREMFRQIYPWSAGFFNYVPPVLLSLLAFSVLEEALEEQKAAPPRCAALLLLGFAGQLFMENNAVCAVLAGGFLTVWTWVRCKRPSSAAVCYFLGTLLGAALLFTSPSYRRVTEADAAYQMAGGLAGLMHTAKENLPELTRWLLAGCPVVCLGFPALAILSRCKQKLTVLDIVPATLLCGSAVWMLFVPWGQALAVLFWFLGAFGAVFRWLSGRKRRRAAFFLAGALAAAAPLAFVTPIGPRCFFVSYVLLLLAAAQFLPPPALWQTLCVGALAAGIFAACLSIYLPIFRTAQVREDAITRAMALGQTQIALPFFPHAEYLWDADTQKLCRAYYYETPGDIEFVFVPQEDWSP